MPLAFSKERKQNEKNNLLDFRLQGNKITLQSRPHSSSEITDSFRPMSTTPTLYQEKHRKTPPWMRPQSADHLSSRSNPRRKLAAKFDGIGKINKNLRKNGSVSQVLGGCSSVEDTLDSETSVTPSPVPSLTDVLRSTNKLKPGLIAKPPIPPIAGASTKRNKSMDDIINIKFQRWFPDSVQKAAHYADTIAAINGGDAWCNEATNISEQEPGTYAADQFFQEVEGRYEERNRKEECVAYSAINYDRYDTHKNGNTALMTSSHGIMTIESTDTPLDSGTHDEVLLNNNSNSSEMLTSKIGKRLNKYLTPLGNALVDHKEVQTRDHQSDESGIASMYEQSDSSAKEMPRSAPSRLASMDEIQSLGLAKVLEDEKATCLIGYMNDNNLQTNSLIAQPTSNKLNNEDILSWMGKNQSLQETEEEIKAVGSTCDDIVNMIKVLEKEEVESLKLEALSAGRSGNNSVCSNVTPVGPSSREILTFLDELDHNDGQVEYSPTEFKKPPQTPRDNVSSVPRTGRMGQLMTLSSAELAKKVMALTLALEEKDAVLLNTNQRLNEAHEKLNKQKMDGDVIVKRHQKFIDQLLTEKKLLGEQCASVIKEMEVKNATALQTMKETHRIEMKKMHEKIQAGEKVKREKWIEEKMKKVKEQTVKGLEPELERMTRAHQDELAELRRAHEKELAEMEASCSRRISLCREQALRDREQAVLEEREASRNKLENELSEIERSFQDQRRRLLAEVQEEKLRIERDLETNQVMRTKQLEDKWQQAAIEMEKKMSVLQEKHEAELKNMRDTLEGERQSWLNHQTHALTQKEAEIKEQMKLEKEQSVNSIVKKMEEELLEKEKSVDLKLNKNREQYENDLKDLEAAQIELKKKLKQARVENQQYEDTLTKLKTQISQLECQLTITKQRLERAERESTEQGALVRSEASSLIAHLQRELAEEKARREETIASFQSEKERELQQVYNRVKEAICRKEEALKLVQKQRDAALEQCCQLESMLEEQRNEYLNRKGHKGNNLPT